MATADQVRLGLARYVDAEIVGKLEGLKRLLAAAAAAAAADNAGAALEKMRQSETARALGLTDAEGGLDAELMHKKLREQLEKQPCTVELPMLGRLTLYPEDADKLYTEIINA